MYYSTNRNKKVFYIFWGIALLILLYTWLGSIIDFKIFTVSPLKILTSSNIMDELIKEFLKELKLPIKMDSFSSTLFSIKSKVFFVYFFFQTILVSAAFFVPKVRKKSYDIFIIVLSIVIIVYMLYLIFWVKTSINDFIKDLGSKSSLNLTGVDFVDSFLYNGLMKTTYFSLRKSIYMAIIIIVGMFVSTMSKASIFIESLSQKEEFGKMKNAFGNVNQMGKNILESGNKFIKTNISNYKIDQLKEQIRKSKINIGKEVYRLQLKNLDVTEDLFPEIDMLEQKILQKEKDLLAAQNRKTCSQCNANINFDSVFCTECGAEQLDIMIVNSNIPPEEIHRTIQRLQFEVNKFYEKLGDIAASKREQMPESVQEYIDVLENNEFELKEYERENRRAVGIKRCNNCGKDLKEDAKFCDSCGNNFMNNKICTECGTKNDQFAYFCNNCGNKLN